MSTAAAAKHTAEKKALPASRAIKRAKRHGADAAAVAAAPLRNLSEPIKASKARQGKSSRNAAANIISAARTTLRALGISQPDDLSVEAVLTTFLGAPQDSFTTAVGSYPKALQLVEFVQYCKQYAGSSAVLAAADTVVLKAELAARHHRLGAYSLGATAPGAEQLQQQHTRRLQACRALAADVDAGSTERLLQQLEYMRSHVPSVPDWIDDDVTYCTQCNTSLFEATLVYVLDVHSAAPRILCRCCFIVALALSRYPLSLQSELPSYLEQLNNHQQQQLRNWLCAAERLKQMHGGLCLPSPNHKGLVSAESLLQRSNWPQEFCVLPDGMAAVQQLSEVVQRAGAFESPPYGDLAKDHPCLIGGWQEPALAKQQAEGDDAAQKPPRAAAVHSIAGSPCSPQHQLQAMSLPGVEALLCMLQPKELLRNAMLDDRAPAADAVAHILAALAPGNSSSSNTTEIQPPYFNLNLIEPQVEAGVANTCALLKQLRGSSWHSTPPNQLGQQMAQVAQQNIGKLLDTAAAADAAGQGQTAQAHRFLATALAIRFSAHTRDVAAHSLVKAALVLLGGAGTGTRGHLDPAAALTFTYAVQMPGEVLNADTVLATWLFVTPMVFTQLPLLRKLLWLLQTLLLHQQVAAAEMQYGSKEAQGKAASKQTAAAKQAASALQLVRAALASHQEKQARISEQQQQQQPATPSTAATLTEDEQGWLQQLLDGYKLTPGEMQQVAQQLGPQYAVLIHQRAGQGVHVPVGWMHWVHNRSACIKIAWELVRAEHMAGALQMQRIVRCRATGLPLDYMAIGQTAAKEVMKWRQFL